jgi:hypothetical protein
VNHFKSQAGDPLHEPGKGGRIGQLGAKGRAARTDGDFAVVEFRTQYRARLAGESDLIGSWLHQGYPSRSAVPYEVTMPGARACVITT